MKKILALLLAVVMFASLFAGCNNTTGNTDPTDTVSYTHLDVYKRQAQVQAGMESAAAGLASSAAASEQVLQGLYGLKASMEEAGQDGSAYDPLISALEASLAGQRAVAGSLASGGELSQGAAAVTGGAAELTGGAQALVQGLQGLSDGTQSLYGGLQEAYTLSLIHIWPLWRSLWRP